MKEDRRRALVAAMLSNADVFVGKTSAPAKIIQVEESSETVVVEYPDHPGWGQQTEPFAKVKLLNGGGNGRRAKRQCRR